MKFNSLLTATVIMGASASAWAFPTITTYPDPDGTYDSVGYLTNIQLRSTESFSIVEDCDMKPYFENWDTGDQFTCSAFFDQDFYGAVLHKIDFNESDFSDNGEWVLTIPAGCLEDGDGNMNDEAIEFHYTLNDPNVGLGEFPQITLISSDPANGASLPYWGEYLGKVTFKTSDDAAVNYIDWTLYDITDGEEPWEREWLRQGNESRVDVNRTFGDDSDQWVNGLYINVGGANEKLLEGRTYRLVLKFCGIGYDPVTNQYPTPQQQAASLELETYLDFKGQSKGTEYSPYEVKEVTPDPAVYDFDNIDIRTFTVFYTGPVKPTMFVYSLGQGVGTVPAGTFTPATEADADGYADAWDFTFEESVLKGADGTIAVTIEAADADGLPVRGNGGFKTDDFEYKIDWNCNLGADVLTSIEPENGATVTVLSSITIGNEKNKEMNLAYGASERPRIVSMGRAGFAPIDLEDPVFNDDQTTATFTFDPITVSGTYSIIIPKTYFIMGEQMFTTTNNQTAFVYIVEGDEPPAPSEVSEDLEPVEVSIENNANYETLDKIVLTFADVTFISFDPIVTGDLYRAVSTSAREEEYELVEGVEPMDNDFFSPTEYTYTFSSPITETGAYKFVIPARAFFDRTFDETGGESGHASPELVYYFSIGDGNGIEGVVTENGTADVYDIAGRVVILNADAARIKSLSAGLYIINGKKYVVK